VAKNEAVLSIGRGRVWLLRLTKEACLKEGGTPGHVRAHIGKGSPSALNRRSAIYFSRPTTRCRIDAANQTGLPIGSRCRILQHVAGAMSKGKHRPDAPTPMLAVIFDKGATTFRNLTMYRTSTRPTEPCPKTCVRRSP